MYSLGKDSEGHPNQSLSYWGPLRRPDALTRLKVPPKFWPSSWKSSSFSLFWPQDFSSTISKSGVTNDLGVIISQYWGQISPYRDNNPGYFGVKSVGLLG